MADDTQHGPIYTDPDYLFGGQLASDITPRGFTHHEHLGDVELIQLKENWLIQHAILIPEG